MGKGGGRCLEEGLVSLGVRKVDLTLFLKDERERERENGGRFELTRQRFMRSHYQRHYYLFVAD